MKPGAKTSAPGTGRARSILALAGLMIVAASTLAEAQVDENLGGDFTCTPGSACWANRTITARKHEERAWWTQIAGAPYPAQQAPADSATSFEVDFFAVRQRNAREALAGGAGCEDSAVKPEDVNSCERVPVIYATDEEAGWREVYRGEGRGYVGAIAWIGRGRALAVGGDGVYPRREPNDPGDQWTYEERLTHDLNEGAGDARAWYLNEGSWREITEELPEEMRGMAALDIWIGREADGDEWGLAGDYGHIWEWRGGKFTGSHIDRDSPSIGGPDPEWSVVDGPLAFTRECTGVGENQTCRWVPAANAPVSDPEFFQYRVREIRIAPDKLQKRAVAFTAGCCGPQSAGGSRAIEYFPQPSKPEAGVPPEEAPPREARPRWQVRDDHPAEDGDYGESVYSFALRHQRYLNFNEAPDEFGETQPSHGSSVWEIGTTVVARAQRGERSEDIPNPAAQTPPRYVASDGDGEDEVFNGNMEVTGNGTADWLAGEAPPSRPDLRGLGVIATTVNDFRPEYGGLRPHCNLPPNPNFSVDHPEAVLYPGDNFSTIFWVPETAYVRVCRAEQVQGGQNPFLDRDGPIQTRESGIQVGPSWSLNGIDMLDSQGVGYAVGDRGAILRFGSPPAEGAAPSLGSRRPAQIADRSAYEEIGPESAREAGEVPPLASQPRESHSDLVMDRVGSPDGNEIGSDLPAEDVHTIIMSRDGSEGWAIGPTREARGLGVPTGGVMTLYEYRNGQWTRCDPVGEPPLFKPDRACADLAPLYRHRESNGQRIRIDAATRVPLEYDGNPANDDELEILAIGSSLERVPEAFSTRAIPTIIRYRAGRWRLEPFEVRSSLNPVETGIFIFDMNWESLACAAPDECWATGVQSRWALRFFNGEHWIDCSTWQSGTGGQRVDMPIRNRAACGDLGNRLPRISSDTTWAKLRVSSAGDRTYLSGVRLAPNTTSGGLDRGQGSPVILYKDSRAGAQWEAENGGYDPGFSRAGAPAGAAVSVGVTKRPDGSFEGWATGGFGAAITVPLQQGRVLAKWPLLRLDPGTGEWSPHRVRDAAHDYLGIRLTGGFEGVKPVQQVTLPGTGSEPGPAYIGTHYPEPGLPAHLLAFNTERERWELAERPGTAYYGGNALKGRPTALAPDGRGGIWATFGTGAYQSARGGVSEAYFYNYTQHPRQQVFAEIATPLAERERLEDMSAAPDGTTWISTDQGVLYRRDRLTGWERIPIPGWDPGRVVTRRSEVNAVAVGPEGSGIAVGPRGRLARITPTSVRLDEAAGTVCDVTAPTFPCGTSFDLHSAAVAPDGSALAGGEKLAVLWAPAGDAVRKINSPDGPRTASIVAISMPQPGRAWLALDSGQIFAGSLNAGRWRWELENTIEVNGAELLPNEDENGEAIPVRDIAVDTSGHGYAVGDRGLVLQRSEEGTGPWTPVDVNVTERLTEVALPSGEGSGALIGGERGLILTLTGGEWRIARPGDQLRPDNGFVVGLELLPGVADGQTEAWAALALPPNDTRTGATQLLHHTNAPEEPLLNPARDLEPLRDAPPARAGETAFAAFGRSDCHLVEETNLIPCPPLENGGEVEQTILRSVRDEVLEHSRQPGGPQFAIFTGDAYETGGPTASEPVEQTSRMAAQAAAFGLSSAALMDVKWTGGEKFRRVNEQLFNFLGDRGLPVFAPVGARDLSEARVCGTTSVSIHCVENRDRGRAGDNFAWRQTMESQPAPWGSAEPVNTGKIAFEPLYESGLAHRHEDQEIDDPTDAVPDTDDPTDEIPETEIPVEDLSTGFGGVDGIVNTTKPDTVGGNEALGDYYRDEKVDDRPVALGGASTHYAADIVRDGEFAARLVVVDTSFGSLSASDPLQQPFEANGGQAGWLERVLCVRGGPYDTGGCTREPEQKAIVVSTSPTYSYGATNPVELQADGALFESIVLRHGASVVVSGRLGWNGRYWTLAPGLHEPCPGQDYIADEDAPAPGEARVCGQDLAGAPAGPDAAASEAQKAASSALDDTGGVGAVPFVVASNAGGRFSDFVSPGGKRASDGFWRGYTVVRLHPSGDPQKTVVEQRPVLDWIRIDGNERVLAARERLDLKGLGREPLGAPLGQLGSGRYDEISSPAITHRFDLVLADPDEPWRACLASETECTTLRARLSAAFEKAVSEQSPADDGVNGGRCAPYLCLPERIGTIDRYTGQTRAGNGRYPDTFAIAMLSVKDQVAAYPLMFKRSPSFVVQAAAAAPALPSPPSVASSPPQPPAPPSPPQPSVPQAQVPNVPVPPAVPPLAATQPPEPLPPVPPAAPPPSQQLSPLNLIISPASLTVATPSAVIQPPTPPVNPAPPSGARREARQRQAATQKSGADADKEGENQQFDGANAPIAPPGAAFTRHDHSFSAISRAEDGSIGSATLYASGITLLALATAFGWTWGRPTPRRRGPEVPAPAWQTLDRRRR